MNFDTQVIAYPQWGLVEISIVIQMVDSNISKSDKNLENCLVIDEMLLEAVFYLNTASSTVFSWSTVVFALLR